MANSRRLHHSEAHTARAGSTLPGTAGFMPQSSCAALDGYSGTLYIEPDEHTLRQLEYKEAVEGRKKELLTRLKGRKNITRDGHEIKIYANILNSEELESAVKNDAGGIGLFRTEFML